MKRYIAIDLIEMHKNNLTMQEWVLLENILFLSNNDIGFCFTSKENLRQIIGVSNGQIYKIIDSLLEKKYITKHPINGYLKITQKWVNISSGDTLQKMESTSPKNGDSTIKYEYKRGVPSEEQVLEVGKQLKINKDTCIKFYLYYESKKWKGVLDFIPLLRKWNMTEKSETPKKKEWAYG